MLLKHPLSVPLIEKWTSGVIRMLRPTLTGNARFLLSTATLDTTSRNREQNSASPLPEQNPLLLTVRSH
jgi:hypothetical protein